MAGNNVEFLSIASAAPNKPVAPAKNMSQILPLLTGCCGKARAKLVACCGATVCRQVQA